MPDGLLGALRYVLLGLLYLFFVRVLFAVAAELRAPVVSPVGEPDPATARAARHRRPPAAPAGRRPALVVRTGEHPGATFGITGETTIGRAGGCAIRLAGDTFASQLHARATLHEGRLVLEDLGSTNGTWVDGVRIEVPTVVRPGAVVRIGRTEFEVV